MDDHAGQTVTDDLERKLKEQVAAVRLARQDAAKATVLLAPYNAALQALAAQYEADTEALLAAKQAQEQAEKTLRALLLLARDEAPELWDGSVCLASPGLSVRRLEKIVVTDGTQVKAWAMAYPEYLLVDEKRLRDMVEATGECPPGIELVETMQAVLSKVL